jgi:hypothetical protein
MGTTSEKRPSHHHHQRSPFCGVDFIELNNKGRSKQEDSQVKRELNKVLPYCL